MNRFAASAVVAAGFFTSACGAQGFAGDAGRDVGTSMSDVPEFDAPVDGGQRQRPQLNLCGLNQVDGEPPAPGSRVGALPNGQGGTACVVFGADPMLTLATDFADASRFAGRSVYVRVGATGGTGSISAPFGTIDEALRSTPEASNVLLSRGTHTVAGTLVIDRNVQLVGVGTSSTGTGSTISLGATAEPGISVRSSSGLFAVARVRFVSGTTTRGQTIEVEAAARAEISDTVFEGGMTAIVVAASGSLQTDRVTVQSTGGDGIVIEGTATLRSTMVAGAAGRGVLVRGRLTTNELLVTRNQQGGIRLETTALPGVDRLERVAAVANVGYGIRVDGTGRESHVIMSSLSATTEVAGTHTAYGAFVANGGSLAFDPGLGAPGSLGVGTLISRNANAGIVAAGTAAAITTHSIRVLRNNGPGMIIESGIDQIVVNESYFGFNVAVGLGLWGSFASASTVQILCDMFEGTVAGTAMFGSDQVRAGDGLFVMSDSPWVSSTPIRGSHFLSNERFGVCLWSASMSIDGGVFRGNAYHVGRYGIQATGAAAPAADQRLELDRNTSMPEESAVGGARGTERMAAPAF